MYSEEAKEEHQTEVDVFMKEFKFYKQIKDIEKLDSNSSVLILNKINDSNLDQNNLKVF